ncbi:MAG: hypothetical protein AAGI52_12710 [Bacteroidota bacterium]
MLTALVLALATAFAGPAAPSASPSFSTPVRDSLTHYYVRHDTRAVRRLHRRASSREDRLLVSYRLFAMTQDQDIISNIPSDDGVRSARQLALISALWAYRAATGPKINLPTHGRRSERILNRASEIAPNDPYVLLVRGQSLLYKPGIFGGDKQEAKETFQRLKRVMRGRTVPGLHPFEADVWIWMCERELDPANARAMKRRLLAQSPPPMFRQFLLDPP